MTAQNDLDRTLGAWFDTVATPAPPREPLARILESTRARRPRPALTAGIGSHWITMRSANGAFGSTARLRPAVVIALVALLVAALIGTAALVGSRLLAPPIAVAHVYRNELASAPDLPTPVSAQALVTLADGRVLVIGDKGPFREFTALVYDPLTGASASVGPMAFPVQWSASSVQLQDGRVVILSDAGVQIFDPTTMRFASVGPMITPRESGSTALLHDGRVLIAGGIPTGGSLNGYPPIRSAELFDPETMTFSPTGSIASSTGGGDMVTLPDGRVFMATDPTAEIYDPATGLFSAASTTSSSAGGHPVVLADGRVVLARSTGLYTGGMIQVWDPGSRTFSDFSLPEPLSGATLLDDGRVFLIGMCRGGSPGWTGVFDPATGATMATPTTQACRPSSTRLADGRVLIVGGVEPTVPTVEIFR